MSLAGIYRNKVRQDLSLVTSLDDTHMERFATVPKTLMINQWSPEQRWLQLDSTYPDQIRKRYNILRKFPQMVIERQTADYVTAGETELRDRVVDYLLQTYPEYFSRQDNLILSPLTGLAVDVGPKGADPLAAVAMLASEDFLLLFPDSDDGHVHLRSGALLFPNGWSLRSHFNQAAPDASDTAAYENWNEWRLYSQRAARLGKTPREIHEDIVPHYMKNFADRVDMFFNKMEPGMLTWRRNWGPWMNDALFRHPDGKAPDMYEETPDNWLDYGYLRSEHETFMRLPQSQAVIFGIKTFMWKLSDILANPVTRNALIVSNDNLPPLMVEYRQESLRTFRPLLDRFRQPAP